ncbi:Ppx/GppA phosphatase family [Synechococcus sp. PCC 7335]|uniref:Ppx/GppA phosphatase family protein n=1 Tax=Synechococcus sp. (strain ATCC 29403 / PCC 7335) TaxID=91464 RepID=UPI00017EB8C9|nr:Ppx/GppA phosphatase family protein [Synechococcus sp. PCC 7335]EDX85262.1 Ppx/GppA phosphatase family [Synechococcus sp. PCC 7335]
MVNTVEAELSVHDERTSKDLDESLSIGRIEDALNLTLQERLLSKGRPELVLVAIDIGTNSIHMVIVKIDATLPSFNIIGKEKDTVRLGDFCEETGSLTEEAMTRGIASLKRCLQIAERFQADDVVAVATSAVREAVNGQVFIDRVKTEVGLSINLIAGKEEARRIYLGVISGMELKGQPHVIVDIGGGSTEIIAGRGGRHDFLSSTKVGAVRLTSQFVTTDPISKEEYTYLKAYVRGMLEPTIDSLRSKLRQKLAGTAHEHMTLSMIGTSGTIECLAALEAIDKTGSEPDPINGCLLTRSELDARINQLRKMSYTERLALPGMSERRAEIVVPGAIILQTVMKLLNISQLKVCERALREGVVVNWMLINGLIEDRMAFQDSIRDRSVRKLANKYKANGDTVAQFATSLFDQTQGVLHNLSLLEREYLWAAAMLHNSGHYISHSAHHKHSYYLIRNGGLLGFTETEIEIIGNIARYHRKNLPKRRHDNYNNLPGKYERKLVDQLGAILRVAVALDRARSQAITSIETIFDDQSRTLTLQLTPDDANNKCELELWNIGYKKAWFEEVFGVSLDATVSVVGN